MKDGDTFVIGDGVKSLTNISVMTGTANKPGAAQVFAILELTMNNGANRPPDKVRVSVLPNELEKIGDLLTRQGRLLQEKLTPTNGPRH